jgi:hypothetical protein
MATVAQHEKDAAGMAASNTHFRSSALTFSLFRYCDN